MDRPSRAGHILAEQLDTHLRLPRTDPLSAMLLDQRVIAGLGTIWSAETAFELGHSPFAPLGMTDASAALETTRRRMLASVEGDPAPDERVRADGATVPGVWHGDPFGSGGHAARTGSPTWCPSCQPA